MAGKYPSLQTMADDLHDAEVVEDANEEERLDPELAARRAAALAHVRKFGDPVLQTKARRVERFDDALRDEIARMGALMHDALGIGLAATQIGMLHRVLVYRVEHDSPVNALINPELEWSGKEKEIDRGGLPQPARASTSTSSGRSTSASARRTSTASRSSSRRRASRRGSSSTRWTTSTAS